jgi:hypothetical protein
LPSEPNAHTDGGLASPFCYFVVILYSASYSPVFHFKIVDNDVTSYFDQPRRLFIALKRIHWFVCL